NIRFTLWWRDTPADADAEPSSDALRLKVHASAYRDYVTLSFYIDAGRAWNVSGLTHGEAIVGSCRRQIFDHIQSIYVIWERRLAGVPGARPMVERDLLPEQDISKENAAALMRSSLFLYSELWDKLWQSLSIAPLSAILGDRARVFANFRGLVLSTW